MTPKERILELTALLNDANHRYYVLDDPKMPDFEYDHLLRELEVLEQGTGIFGRACTLLLRHAEIVCGHEQLYIALQADDAELSQGDKQLTPVTVDHQIFFEAAANICGHIGGGGAAAAAGP